MEFVLPALILVPLIGAIITLFMGGSRQKYACTVALVFTVATLLLSLILMITNVNDLSKFDVNYGWINAAGLKMSIILTVDGLSLLMVFLTAMLEVLVIAFSYKALSRRRGVKRIFAGIHYISAVLRVVAVKRVVRYDDIHGITFARL